VQSPALWSGPSALQALPARDGVPDEAARSTMLQRLASQARLSQTLLLPTAIARRVLLWCPRLSPPHRHSNLPPAQPDAAAGGGLHLDALCSLREALTDFARVCRRLMSPGDFYLEAYDWVKA